MVKREKTIRVLVIDDSPSNRRAIKSAIYAANEIVNAAMNEHIVADIARANTLLAEPASA